MTPQPPPTAEEVEAAKSRLIKRLGIRSDESPIDLQTLLSSHAHLEAELKDTRILLAEKNETANVFMNQVKKLQAELAKERERLHYLQKHCVKQIYFQPPYTAAVDFCWDNGADWITPLNEAIDAAMSREKDGKV